MEYSKKERLMDCLRPDLAPSTVYSHYGCKCSRCVEYNRLRNRRALAVTRKCRLQKKYGLSMDQYVAILAAQHGVCAICEKPRSAFKRDFSVDHDHKTGRIRGVLCGNCNTALGKLHDDVNLFKRAIEYIDKM